MPALLVMMNPDKPVKTVSMGSRTRRAVTVGMGKSKRTNPSKKKDWLAAPMTPEEQAKFEWQSRDLGTDFARSSLSHDRMMAAHWAAASKRRETIAAKRAAASAPRSNPSESHIRAELVARAREQQGVSTKPLRSNGRKNTSKESKHMARYKKRKNPYHARRNPDSRGRPTPFERELARVEKQFGTAARLKYEADILAEKAAAAAGRKTRGPAKPKVAKTEAEKAASRAAATARLAAARAKIAAMSEAEKAAYKIEVAAKRQATKAKRAAREESLMKEVAALRAVSAPLPRGLGKRLLALEARAAKREAGRLAAAPGRSARAQSRAFMDFSKRQSAFLAKGYKAQALAARIIRKKKSKGNMGIARAYMSAKSAVAKFTDPSSKRLARVLGLSALPNPSLKSMGQDFMAFLPMAALGIGSIWGLSWGLSKVKPMVRGYMPSVNPGYVDAAVALLGGFAAGQAVKAAGSAMGGKAGASYQKWSALFTCGGIALAAVSLSKAVQISGKSVADTVGLSGMGDYHMGMRVGDYHMGGEVAKLNVGDYHMGQIDVITDRRMLAPPGEPMPRHDTRRDNVDESITAFTGSLAGDIFDS